MNTIIYREETASAQAENKGFLGISDEIPIVENLSLPGSSSRSGIIAELARSPRSDLRVIAALLTIASENRKAASPDSLRTGR